MDYSRINDTLYIGTSPSVQDYPLLERLGVRLVINMRLESPPSRPRFSPIKTLWLPTVDLPFLPIPLSFLTKGVRVSLNVIQGGGGVYAHCSAGRHRSVAMGAAILIAQGHTPEQAMALIKEKRQIADPDVWYIRRQILRFAKLWQQHHAGDVSCSIHG